jgi:hypothetical protein
VCFVCVCVCVRARGVLLHSPLVAAALRHVNAHKHTLKYILKHTRKQGALAPTALL